MRSSKNCRSHQSERGGIQWSRQLGLARDLLEYPPANVPMFTHYIRMARQLSVAGIARAGVRRVYGAALRMAYRPGSDFLPGSESKSAALAARILEGSNRLAWSDVSRRDGVLSTLERIPGALERAMARADRAARREFDVFGAPLSFGASRIDWSLDPVAGYRYPLAPSGSLRLDPAGVDPKYPWALGRLDQLIALGQGYWVCDAPGVRTRFAEEFIAQVEDFGRANPAALGIHWTIPMEVALRAANMAAALLMFRDSPQVRDPRFVLLVLRSLIEHCSFVEAHLENGGAVPNNHLVANYVGLLVVGVAYPELPRARRWTEIAARRLSDLIRAQVCPDGYSFEGSTSYHRLALELFTLAYACAMAGGIDLGGLFRERLRKMFLVAATYCSERGLAPQIGDNDSGRPLPLRDRQSLDHSYLAALGASLLGDPALKLHGAEFPDEAAWLLGQDGWERFESLASARPPMSFGSPKGGLYVLRGAGAVATVSGGPQGQNGIGGHNHNDKLSFELHLDGYPVIVDVGTGTYLRDLRLRNAFRGTAAHNALQLDGREQATLDPSHPFALPSNVPTVLERFETSEARQILVLRHGRAPLGPVIRRSFVLSTDERALWVTDEVVRGRSKRAIGRLHVPDRQCRIREVRADEHLRSRRACEHSAHFGSRAAEIGPPDGPRATILFSAGLQVAFEAAPYSPGYGEVQPAGVLV